MWSSFLSMWACQVRGGADNSGMDRGDLTRNGGTLPTRRRILSLGGAIGVSLALGKLTGRAAAAQKADTTNETEEEISPAEDLMREHGVLERVLLVYETSMARIAGQGTSPLP